MSRGEVAAYRCWIGHPLAQKLIDDCKNKPLPSGHIRFDYSSRNQKPESVSVLVGQSGLLSLSLLAINGADEQDHLILTALSGMGEILPPETVRRLFDLPAQRVDTLPVHETDTLRKATETRKNVILSELAAHQANWFEEEIEKLNFWAEDKRKGLKAELKDYDEQIAELEKEARLAANLPDKLAIQKKLQDLDKKRDEVWKAYDEDTKTMEKQKDELLDTVEEGLKQTIEEKLIFTIQWSVV